jgi:hypothetical protein
MGTRLPRADAARLLAVTGWASACILALYAPSWFIRPDSRSAGVEAPQPAPPPAPPREIPKIIALDPRVAERVNDLRPCVKERLARVAKKLPAKVKLLVTSAHRTREEQAAIRPTFGIKAKPGTSTHEDGRAVDLNVIVDGKRISPRVQQKVIGPVMASEGFRHLGPRDPVHYSVPKSEIDPLAFSTPDLEVMTVDEMFQVQEELRLAEAAELQQAQALAE